jgi:hypothetical protein
MSEFYNKVVEPLTERRAAVALLLSGAALLSAAPSFASEAKNRRPTPVYTQGMRIINLPGVHTVIDLCRGHTWTHEDITAKVNSRGGADLLTKITNHPDSRYCRDKTVTEADHIPVPSTITPTETTANA